MEVSQLILSLHVFAAISLGSALSVTAMALYKADSHYYKPLAIALGIITGALTITGLALLVLLPETGLVSFCSKMAVFLSLTAIAEYMLWQRLRAVATEAEG